MMLLKKIAEFCSLLCHEDREIHGAKTLQDATSSDITCFNNMKYLESLKTTKAGACFLKEEHVPYLPAHTIPLVTPTPYANFGKALQLLYPHSLRPLQPDDRAQAFIHASVQIGNNCRIGPFCVLEKGVVLQDNVTLGASCVIKENVVIGKETYLEDHVTLAHSLVGERVFIKAGARIGQPGFGFDMTPQGAIDIPQLGQVIIHDDVQIGANTCIDRGSLSNTIIHKGVRIDNLVQIAHNVEIKENAVIVAQSGIAGSTSIGAFSVLGGQVGIAGHLSIGSGVQVAAQSGVMKNIPDKSVVGGSPAVLIRDWHRQTLYLQKIIKKDS